jgi:competence protein ComEA
MKDFFVQNATRQLDIEKTEITISSQVDKEVTMTFSKIRTTCVLMLCLVVFCCSLPVLAQNTGAGATPASKTATAAKINLNSATADQLAALPGVGPATAALIIEYRTNVGKFTRVEELLNVRGIGEKKFEALKDLLTL